MRGQPLEGLERSFKMSAGSFLPNRYLLGIRKDEASLDALLGVCAQIGMPAAYRANFRESFPPADTIHFGFEENESGGVYKAYLEFRGELNKALASSPGATGAVLLYLAFKWDSLDAGKHTIATYRCHPRLPVEAIHGRLAQIYAGHPGTASAEAVAAVIRLADTGAAPPMYLDVGEEGNPRHSFDINFYDAGLRLGDIGHLLERARMQFSVAEEKFRPVFERIRGAKLGHLSGGVGRDGKDFLTVYYEGGAH
jgi:hypothetical protein